MLTLGANILVTVMATLFVLTCLFMMLVILIQKPKGGGLSGAFGGAGGSAQAAFGAKTGDLLTTITIACFIAFLGLAIGLVYAIRDEVNPNVPVVTPVSAPATTTAAPGTGGADADETRAPQADGSIPAETVSEPVTPPADDAATPDAPKPDVQP
jgi:preprotein translocase subunit SecG